MTIFTSEITALSQTIFHNKYLVPTIIYNVLPTPLHKPLLYKDRVTLVGLFIILSIILLQIRKKLFSITLMKNKLFLLLKSLISLTSFFLNYPSNKIFQLMHFSDNVDAIILNGNQELFRSPERSEKCVYGLGFSRQLVHCVSFTS